MKAMILSTVAALGLCLTTAAPARAQYVYPSYYYPNTSYVYTFYPGFTGYYPPYAYYPYWLYYRPWAGSWLY